MLNSLGRHWAWVYSYEWFCPQADNFVQIPFHSSVGRKGAPGSETYVLASCMYQKRKSHV